MSLSASISHSAGGVARGKWRRWWDLRFESIDEEIAFTRTLEKDLLKSTAVSCALANVFITFAIFEVRKDFLMNPRPFLWEASDPRTVVFIELLVLFAWHALVAVASAVRYKKGRFRFVDWELLNVGTWTMNASLMCLLNKVAVSHYYGVDVEDAFYRVPPSIEFNALLVILLAVSVLCSYVPVRLHKMWVMPVTSILAVILSVVTWDFVEAAYGPLTLAFTILMIFLVSGRQKEISKRETWKLIQGLQAQEKELQHRQASTSRLLSSFCDCVFTITRDLRLVDPSKSLGTVLLRSQSVQAGTDICSLIKHAHDKDRFKEFVLKSNPDEQDEDAQALPSSLMLDFCDAIGHCVCARIYLASVRTADGMQHMVGVVEASERHYPETEGATTSSGSGGDQQVFEHISVSECSRSRYSRNSKAHAAEDELLSVGTFEDSLLNVNVQMQEKPKNEPLCATVHMSYNMKIARCNEGFAAGLGGNSAGSFKAYLEDAEAFHDWLDELKENLSAGAIEPPALREFGIVDVKKKTGEYEPMWLAVVLPVSEEAPLQESLLQGSYHINIRLTEPVTTRAVQALAKRKVSNGRNRGNAGTLLAVMPGLPGSV